jgi:hypothetical protein
MIVVELVFPREEALKCRGGEAREPGLLDENYI